MPNKLEEAGISWLIIGACTSGNWMPLTTIEDHHNMKLQLRKWGKRWTLQPKVEWVREIVEAADKVGIPVFLKDNLEPLIKWPDAGAWAFKPLSNRLRQEMPKGEK